MKILIMNGPPESGKDTVSNFLKDLFPNKRIKSHSSIGYIKEVALIDFGWDGVKDIAGRNLLYAIKKAMTDYNDLPFKKIKTLIKIWIADILIVDIREPDEIEKLVNHCKKVDIICHTCRIHNTKAENKAEKNKLLNVGDRVYGRYDYDINIDNNGTLEELKEQTTKEFSQIY